ncbi:hypothetical protein KAR28_03935 [Candidatus Parcubacteria bacterium]|nr:hypothetical protein [Candidatus Parcubacteria bacterium]
MLYLKKEKVPMLRTKQKIKMNTVILLLFCFLVSGASLVGAAIASTELASLSFLVNKEKFLDPEYLYVDIAVKPNTNSINAGLMGIEFDPAALELVSTSIASSCPLLIGEFIDNESGRADLMCGSPIAITDNSAIFHLIFKKKIAGFTNLNFLSHSSLLSADGRGTPVPVQMENHNIFIVK